MKKIISILVLSLVIGLFALGNSYAEEGWISPTFGLKETYEDNIYLTRYNEKSDLITTVSPGVLINPDLGEHKLSIDIHSDLNFFNDYHSQDTNNYISLTNLDLNFNNFSINFDNKYSYFTDRSGAEDVNRVKRLQDHSSLGTTFDFNKLDLTVRYLYRYEYYRTDDAIGDYLSQALSYKDLNRQENTVEIESAFKLWPKTALLLSADYGGIDHNTGKKSDSKYYDLFVGARGEPTAKCIVEGKVGYRDQGFNDDAKDFDNLVFYGSIVENFSAKDALRFDFLRTTNDTIFTDNPYYEISFGGLGYEHKFNERFLGGLKFSYQLDAYPVAVRNTENNIVEKREDDVWKTGARLQYDMPVGAILELKYEHTVRDSNFSAYDYKNNLVSVGAKIVF